MSCCRVETPSPITYPAGVVKPQAILDEDAIIARWPLKIPAANIAVTPVTQMFE